MLSKILPRKTPVRARAKTYFLTILPLGHAGLGGHKDAPNKGILFIADTAAQMKKAIKHITAVRNGKVGEGSFGLLVDEADSMQRSEDDRLQLEQRLKDLLKDLLKGEGEGFVEDQRYGARAEFRGPCLVSNISATLLPVLLKMYKMQQHRGESKLLTFFTKAPQSKYVGVLSEVWQPLKREGRETFLKSKEATGQNLGGILDGHYDQKDVKVNTGGNVLALYQGRSSCPSRLSPCPRKLVLLICFAFHSHRRDSSFHHDLTCARKIDKLSAAK